MSYGYATDHSTSANLTTYITRKLLSILRVKLDRFANRATPGDIPIRQGSKVNRWILPVDIGTFTTAISEFGSANEVATLTWSTYEATVSTYGAFSKISDMAEATWLPQARQKVSEVFGYSAAKTIELLHYNNAIGAAGASSFIVAGQTSADTGTLAATDTFKAHDIAVVGGYFDRLDAEGFDELGGDYVLVVHGEPAQDLQTHVEPGGATTGVKLAWADIQKNTVPGQRKLERYEIGVYAGVSVQKSNLVTTATLTNTITAYKNVGMSKDFLGKCNFDMKNFRVIEVPTTPDKSDPLGLYGTVGWKARLGHRGLVRARGVVLYTAK